MLSFSLSKSFIIGSFIWSYYYYYYSSFFFLLFSPFLLPPPFHPLSAFSYHQHNKRRQERVSLFNTFSFSFSSSSFSSSSSSSSSTNNNTTLRPKKQQHPSRLLLLPFLSTTNWTGGQQNKQLSPPSLRSEKKKSSPKHLLYTTTAVAANNGWHDQDNNDNQKWGGGLRLLPLLLRRRRHHHSPTNNTHGVGVVLQILLSHSNKVIHQQTTNTTTPPQQQQKYSEKHDHLPPSHLTNTTHYQTDQHNQQGPQPTKEQQGGGHDEDGISVLTDKHRQFLQTRRWFRTKHNQRPKLTPDQRELHRAEIKAAKIQIRQQKQFQQEQKTNLENIQKTIYKKHKRDQKRAQLAQLPDHLLVTLPHLPTASSYYDTLTSQQPNKIQNYHDDVGNSTTPQLGHHQHSHNNYLCNTWLPSHNQTSTDRSSTTFPSFAPLFDFSLLGSPISSWGNVDQVVLDPGSSSLVLNPSPFPDGPGLLLDHSGDGVENYLPGPAVVQPDKPNTPTLPAGEFRPKQSLGQNYIADHNYVRKICGALAATDERGSGRGEGGTRVIELGPGVGALTKVLYQRYPKMTAIEIDARAVSILLRGLPGLDVIHDDVLQVDWPSVSRAKGGKLSVIGNLPFYITSQILFCLLDSRHYIKEAVVTVQLEVGQRILAKPGDRQYSRLSVAFQLYTKPTVLFKIPNKIFYPIPNVEAVLIRLTFPDVGESPKYPCNERRLRDVLHVSFQQRRKMLRQSLKVYLEANPPLIPLPVEWGVMRPQLMTPQDFVTLTSILYGQENEKGSYGVRPSFRTNKDLQEMLENQFRKDQESKQNEKLEVRESGKPVNRIWRKQKHGVY